MMNRYDGKLHRDTIKHSIMGHPAGMTDKQGQCMENISDGKGRQREPALRSVFMGTLMRFVVK
jgi:hypothetical protein